MELPKHLNFGGGLYMQDMDPGPAKILHKPEKLKVTLIKCRSRMKRPVAEHGSKTQEN